VSGVTEQGGGGGDDGGGAVFFFLFSIHFRGVESLLVTKSVR